MGHACTKKLSIVHPKFIYNQVTCILSDNTVPGSNGYCLYATGLRLCICKQWGLNLGASHKARTLFLSKGTNREICLSLLYL